MKRGLIIGSAAIILICLLFVLSDQSKTNEAHTPTSTSESEVSNTATDVPAKKQVEQPDPNDPRVTRQADGSVYYNPSIQLSKALNTTIDPQDSVELINELFSHYRFAYKENPVGVDNFEFTEQLLGKNPMRIVFIDPQSSAIKENELVDTWGTPYFFHPLSGQDLEIRSAGPDRQLWTKDDVLSKGDTKL